MSVQASSWVWENSHSANGARLVLLSLADHAGADGGDAWPSVARLAARTNLSERAVRRGLRELEALEEIVTTFHDGRSSRYRMTFHSRGQIDPPDKSTGVKTDAHPGQKRRGTPAKSAPKPKEEPSGTTTDPRGVFLPGTGWVAPFKPSRLLQAVQSA